MGVTIDIEREKVPVEVVFQDALKIHPRTI
jgi:hypothetical protein